VEIISRHLFLSLTDKRRQYAVPLCQLQVYILKIQFPRRLYTLKKDAKVFGVSIEEYSSGLRKSCHCLAEACESIALAV